MTTSKKEGSCRRATVKPCCRGKGCSWEGTRKYKGRQGLSRNSRLQSAGVSRKAQSIAAPTAQAKKERPMAAKGSAPAGDREGPSLEDLEEDDEFVGDIEAADMPYDDERDPEFSPGG